MLTVNVSPVEVVAAVVFKTTGCMVALLELVVGTTFCTVKLTAPVPVVSGKSLSFLQPLNKASGAASSKSAERVRFFIK